MILILRKKIYDIFLKKVLHSFQCEPKLADKKIMII